MDTRLISKKNISLFFTKIYWIIYIIAFPIIYMNMEDELRYKLKYLLILIGFIVLTLIFLKIQKVKLVKRIYRYLNDGVVSEKAISNKNTIMNFVLGYFNELEKSINKINKLIVDKDSIYKKESKVTMDIIERVINNIDNPIDEITTIIEKEDYSHSNLTKIEEKGYKVRDTLSNIIEASKIANNIILINSKYTDITFLLKQKYLDYIEEMKESNLELIENISEEDLIAFVDGDILSKVLDILLTKVIKYSQKETRVYLSLERDKDRYKIVIKNISRERLNISSKEFIRNKVGISYEIAKGLIKGMNGIFEVEVNGDLFITNIILNNKEIINGV